MAMKFIVIGISECSLTLKDKKGREFELGQSDLKLLDHALVSTVHGSQGLTADHVFFSTDKSLSRESMYVGLSRGKKTAKVFTQDEKDLMKYGNQSKRNKMSREFAVDNVFQNIEKAEQKWRNRCAELYNKINKEQSQELSM